MQFETQPKTQNIQVQSRNNVSKCVVQLGWNKNQKQLRRSRTRIDYPRFYDCRQTDRMKDRLGDLQQVSKDQEEAEFYSCIDEEELDHMAVVFEEKSTMDQVFKAVQSLRKEIALLRLDVKRLGMQTTRFLTSVRGISTIKRDANAIARDIRVRGESIYCRLRELETWRNELEENHGGGSTLARIARTQYASVMHAFHDAMFEYNRAEMAQREFCKARIQRQVGIMGGEVSGEQIEEMIETGQWNIFSQNVLTEGKTSRLALAEIEKRHKELLDLEGRVQEIHDLFLQMALLVENQGCALENIEANVCATRDHLGRARTQIKKAIRCKRRNPCRKMFCCC